MMEKIMNPKRENWSKILARPQLGNDDLAGICRDIFAEVRRDGDRALKKYTWFFDRVKIDDFVVTEAEFENAGQQIGADLKEAIREARKNILAFHTLQMPERVEIVNPVGFRCWQEWRGIEKVGLYIPGGSAPLFSTVLMLAIPAQLAGCKEIVLCTPPDRNGQIDPAILWTAELCGIRRVFKMGGVQAIGAMTLGTETIPAVYKIFGPGNRFVTAAKQLAGDYGVAIDLPAGPSEVMIVADASASPAYIAADLLSQAEHGPDSQVVLVTAEPGLPDLVTQEIQRQLPALPRQEIAKQALEHAKFIVMKDLDECMALMNDYAPEHLILCIRDYQQRIAQVVNAGSVFLGNYSTESAGDYASGTNHTLPTNGYAKAYSGVNMDAFLKKITFQEITQQGLQALAPTIETMARNEKLEAHRKAVEIRRR